jgi:hypothetical protein
MAIFSQETMDENNPMILWDPIPDAIKYQLEIRDENKVIILKKNLTETSYNLNLEPGNYSHRVGAYNKFNKLDSQTEWIPFIISKVLVPEVTSEKKIISFKDNSINIILIKGNNFSKNTKVSLTNESGSIPITSIKFKKGSFKLTIDNENAKTGNYVLTLENPRNKILTIKDFYILQNKSLITLPTSSYPYWKEAGMSMILPGWGQIKKQQIFSAIFLDMALIISAGYYKSRLDSFYSGKNNYNGAVSRGILFQEAKIQDGALYGMISSEAQFHKVESSASSTHMAINVLLSLYCINILDALLWKSSVKTASNEIETNFYTKVQMNPIVNTSSMTISPQIEFGFKVQF